MKTGETNIVYSFLMEEKAPQLSVVLIAKNEALVIGKCLSSIKGVADEMVVVDTGSTDDTVAIAKSHGARVILEPWRHDFSHARNRSLQEARGKFILWLDADDILPESSIEPLRSLLDADESAWSFVIDNLYEGRKGQSFRQIRLFPNHRAIRFEGRIHESLSPSLASTDLSIRHSAVHILHTGYNSEEARQQKRERNHTLLLAEIKDHPEDLGVLMEMGNSHHQRGEYYEAIECYRRITLLPGAETKQKDIVRSVPSLVGVSLLAAGDIDGAEEAFQISLAHYPEKASAYYHLAEIAIKKNRPDELLKMSEALIALPLEVTTVAADLDGMVAHAYGWAGNLRLIRGDAAKAIELFLAAEKRGLPPAFQYESALEAAKLCRDEEAERYFKNKIREKTTHGTH